MRKGSAGWLPVDKDKLEDMDVSLTFCLCPHDFPGVIVTKPVGIFQTAGCHTKDMDIIFPWIPVALLCAKWFGISALSKSSIF